MLRLSDSVFRAAAWISFFFSVSLGCTGHWATAMSTGMVSWLGLVVVFLVLAFYFVALEAASSEPVVEASIGRGAP